MTEEKKQERSILITTPMYGGMCTGTYTFGLLRNIHHLTAEGVGVYWGHMTNESLITRARNELVRIFLDETDFTHFMFIDADIGFPPDAVMTLLNADKDVVCGVYPKKEIDWAQVNKAAQLGKENVQDYAGAFVLNVDSAEPKADETGCFEVRHGGTGFMLIKRHVFETLKPHVPTYRTSTAIVQDTGEYTQPLTHEFFSTSIDHTGALLSEDYHFCELWRKHGGKIHLNPFIPLSHVGTYVYTGNLFKGGANLK